MSSQSTTPANVSFQQSRSPLHMLGSGTRSPIHDRAPPIRLVDPRTNRIVNVKSSRTATTAASLQNGSYICRDFLERNGCQAGAYCPNVHVLGREHIWESIHPVMNPNDGKYVGGFALNCYDTQMVKYLSIPSETVYPSQGSTSYISMFNENGENFKARFQVCKHFYETDTCPNGAACSDIHTCIKDFRSVISHETHVCDDDTLHHYQRLPHEVVVRVYQQNSTEDYTDFPGDQVLLTQGAQQYMDAYYAEGRQVPRKKMQHCAHFRLKRLCRVGAGCKFIHVVNESVTSGAQLNPDVDEEMDLAIQSQTSHPQVLESPRSGAESPTSELNVVVRERARGTGYRSPLEAMDGVGSANPVMVAPQVARPKGLGPADIAAMFAMRVNTGQAANPVALQPAMESLPLQQQQQQQSRGTVSPSRHNPYQPVTIGQSSTELVDQSMGSSQNSGSLPVSPQLPAYQQQQPPQQHQQMFSHQQQQQPTQQQQQHQQQQLSAFQVQSMPLYPSMGQQQQQQQQHMQPPPQFHQQQNLGSYPPMPYPHMPYNNGNITQVIPSHLNTQHQQQQQQQQQQHMFPQSNSNNNNNNGGAFTGRTPFPSNQNNIGIPPYGVGGDPFSSAEYPQNQHPQHTPPPGFPSNGSYPFPQQAFNPSSQHHNQQQQLQAPMPPSLPQHHHYGAMQPNGRGGSGFPPYNNPQGFQGVPPGFPMQGMPPPPQLPNLGQGQQQGTLQTPYNSNGSAMGGSAVRIGGRHGNNNNNNGRSNQQMQYPQGQ